MKNLNDTVVIGVFDNHLDADRAVADLRRAGFRDEQIGIAARHPDSEVEQEEGMKALAVAATGAFAGASAGGLLALSLLSGVIPGVGLAVVGGSLAVLLAGTWGGAALGTVVATLVGLGIPVQDAQHYEGELKAGRTLVTVKDLNARYEEAWEILERDGAYNKHTPRAMAGETV